jgi:hypothetical protein
MGPVEWVRECSEARGTARALLWALAERAEGCVARCTAEEAIREGRLSRAELYKTLWRLSHLREVERMLKRGDKSRVRTFHLVGYCKSPRFAGFCSVSARKQKIVSDLRDRRQDAEGCCLCRGSGWKLVPRMDGLVGNVAVKCRAHVKQLALMELPRSWEQVITPEQLMWRSRQLKGEFALRAC